MFQKTKMAKEEIGGGGDFIKMSSESFDIILNVLIGVRRSLSNLIDTSTMPDPSKYKLKDWQFKKVLMTESDWMSTSSTGNEKRIFRFKDYAPAAF